jgi:hypothetical protein
MQPDNRLANSAGFDVLASDGLVGVVETPLFPPNAAEPDFLVVRVLQGAQTRRPVLSTALVESVDVERRAVCVRGPSHTLVRLPERLPIAF